MDSRKGILNRCSVKKTDRYVRFCENCDEKRKCKLCDKAFDKQKSVGTTSFHQIKKDLTRLDKDKAEMIVDLGCPNSVIGACDVDKFIKRRS